MLPVASYEWGVWYIGYWYHSIYDLLVTVHCSLFTDSFLATEERILWLRFSLDSNVG